MGNRVTITIKGLLTFLILSISFLSVTIGRCGTVKTIILQQNYLPTTSYTGCADSYVAQDTPTTNYGSSQVLEANYITGYSREAYIKFDLSPFSISSAVTVQQSRLTFYVELISGEPNRIHVYETGSTWIEDLINWQNAPPKGNYQDHVDLLLANQYYTVSVIDAVQNAISASTNQGLGLVLGGIAGLDSKISISSSESSDIAKRPKLLITYYDPNNPPGPPQNVIITFLSVDKPPTISWTFNDQDSGDTQTGYQVIISRDISFATIDVDSGMVASTANFYTPATSLKVGGTYYVKVRTKDPNGDWSEYSPPKSFINTAMTSLITEETVFCAPNPVRGPTANIKYYLRDPSTVTIEIFNIVGEKIVTYNEDGQAGENIKAWNVNNVANGVYIYRVKAKSNTTGEMKAVTKKLAVLK